MNLSKVVDVVEDKCVNCHQCISVCPSKFANNGFEDIVNVNHDLCIGCGQCIKACSHDARVIVDDFDEAISAINNNEKLIAIVAPAIAASFPDTFLNLNGWLRSIGVEAVFDVSFGAELTIKSYLEYVASDEPQTLIAQPCPAIVSYVQLYKPELLAHLAPAHSPMMHTVVIVKEFYQQFKDHKIIVVSPCTAKKREIQETGLADYNVTFSSLTNYFEQNKIDLNKFDETEFENTSAERASLFSTPGGLLETAEREMPGIRNKIRKIEGSVIYEYLDNLPSSIEKGKSPLIVDCLNCHSGCNGGTGTDMAETPVDELDYLVSKRADKLIEKYKGEKKSKNIANVVDKYWKPGIYKREYENLHNVYIEQVRIPAEKEQKALLKQMHKTSDEDMYNCASCGYNSCNDMAHAIHNKLNKKENCFHYNQKEIEKQNKVLDRKIEHSNKIIQKKNKAISTQKNDLIVQSEQLLDFLQNIRQLIK